MTPDRRHAWTGGVIGSALLLAGLGALLVAWGLPAAPVEVVGANRPVNAGALDAADVRSHNSPAIARNPNHAANLVLANRVDAPDPGCELHLSRDGGVTWHETQIPVPDADLACFAPDVGFGPDGRLYVTFVTVDGLRNEPTAAWLATSSDGGATLSEPTQALDQGVFHVTVAADPTRPGRVYLAWLDASAVGPWGFADAGNPLLVQRSDDGGASWQEAVTVNAAEHRRPLAPTVHAGPDGDVYLAYLDLGGDELDYHGAHEGQGGRAYDGHWSLTLARSADGGASWEHTGVDDQLVPFERIIAFFAPRPALAVDGQRVHVAFHDARRGGADVWLWTSPDGGARFAEPVRVNDTDDHDDATAQYLPALDLAGGRLDVVYYDRRDDPDNTFNHVSLQSSHDHGQTFSPRVRVSDEAFDSRIGEGSARNLADLGSRLALTSRPETAVAVWTDTRAGTHTSSKQDLAQAHVAFTPAAAWRGPLRLVGLAMATVGLGVTARWVARRRPTSRRFTRPRAPVVNVSPDR